MVSLFNPQAMIIAWGKAKEVIRDEDCVKFGFGSALVDVLGGEVVLNPETREPLVAGNYCYLKDYWGDSPVCMRLETNSRLNYEDGGCIHSEKNLISLAKSLDVSLKDKVLYTGGFDPQSNSVYLKRLSTPSFTCVGCAEVVHAERDLLGVVVAYNGDSFSNHFRFYGRSFVLCFTPREFVYASARKHIRMLKGDDSYPEDVVKLEELAYNKALESLVWSSAKP